ncbi:MAG: class I SAM-dependent methyltransferase [Verrucomicrobiae bacterium]|nr:class I SAM-dependent methyltransferase [Verrucomicrobiae bacterium]
MSARDSEEATRAKYESGERAGYEPANVSRLPGGSGDYFDRLLELKLDAAAALAPQGRLLDLGCGNGLHLLALQEACREGIGIDFSRALLGEAERRRRGEKVAHVRFAVGNARRLPVRDASVDGLFSFSALYYMPHLNEVLMEIARVLRPGGKCLLELGHAGSLNALVARAHPELAESFLLGRRTMRRELERAGLKVEREKRLQILPLWGERPAWLRPALGPRAKSVLQRRLGGRMVDEWLCSVPGLGRAAFRWWFWCVKERVR